MSLIRNQDCAVHENTHGPLQHCKSCGYGSVISFWDTTTRTDRLPMGMAMCLNESCNTWERTADLFGASNFRYHVILSLVLVRAAANAWYR